jgi:5-methylcytosine-specific restriction endonuclease McrA
MTRTACLEPGCAGVAVAATSRCARHQRTRRLTTKQRGYGIAWQRTSRALRDGARCAECGTARDLTVDHVVPGDASRLRVLCRVCHGRIGVQARHDGRPRRLAGAMR